MSGRGKPKASRFDAAVGARARERRVMLGLSQRAVAAHLGVTHQQFCKYENGDNKLSPERLSALAAALSTTSEALLGEDGREAPVAHPEQPALVEMIAAYRTLPDHARAAVRATVRALAAQHKDKSE